MNIIQKYKQCQTFEPKHLAVVSTLIQEGMALAKALSTVAHAYGYDVHKFHEAYIKLNQQEGV